MGAYLYGRTEGAKLNEAKHVLAEERVRQSEEAMQRVAAQAIAGITVSNRTIRQEVQREIVEKPVYRDCVADPGILRSINAAKTGRTEPAGDLELPGTAPVN